MASTNLVTIFRQVAAVCCERTAIRDRERDWTYRSLEREANGVAGRIVSELGDGEEPVLLLTDHRGEHVVGRLGVLMAGKAVVSLDVHYPREQLRAIAEESGARLILADAANAGLASEMVGESMRVVVLDERIETDGAPVADWDGSRLSGILFTSGSTGTPKGVKQTHRSVLWNVRNYTRSAGLSADDRMSLVTRGQFAAASSATFGALLNGACLLPFDPRRDGLREMQEWMEREEVSVLHCVPTLYRRFCESLAGKGRFENLRLIKLGGEGVTNHDIRLLHRHFSGACDLLNGLGMTEANGNLTHFRIGHGREADFSVVPAGRAVEGVELIIFREDGSVAATGEAGEIACRSRFLSPGYWRSDGFAERFVDVPGRGAFFRTGDVGLLREDGCLEHHGRCDRQVKIRGQRVEPALVEAAITGKPEVARCAVKAFGSGSKERRLAAYVLAADGKEIDPVELRGYLEGRLSSSHIPTWIIPVSELPLTIAGKVDYGQLPEVEPGGDGEGAGKAGEGARDGLEMVLMGIWERVLKRKVGGVDERFIDLGGDSLMAALMLSRVERKLDTDLPLASFWEEPTIRALAELVRMRGTDSSYLRVVSIRKEGEREPFFRVPSAGADVATLINPDWGKESGRPIYGVQYRGIDGVERAHDRVEDMAAYVVEEMRRVQAHGPYHLGGVSFGGLVAFEAACQLRDVGESTALLILSDTRLEGHARPRAGVGLRGWCERAVLKLLPVGEQVAVTRESVKGALRQAWYRGAVPFMRRRSARRGKPMPKVYRFYDLLNRAVVAKRRYEPRAYEGPVVLLRREEQAPVHLFDVDPTLGWGGICPQLEIMDIPGGHGPMKKGSETYAAYVRVMDELMMRRTDSR
ncbi:MAG: AMP-binding protein [Verrucomicrobiota bacterium]